MNLLINLSLQDLGEAYKTALQWGATAGIVVVAAMGAISVLAFFFNKINN